MFQSMPKSAARNAGSSSRGVADEACLTVAECLRLTPLDQGEVLSGRDGLGRLVQWVHVVDHSDPEDSLAEGELLLTSGIALSQDSRLRAEIFGIMQRQNSAGLVIALGRYMREVPRAMLQAGDASGIPVIGLPWEVNFGDITRALLTPLVHAHYRYLERSEELGRELLDLLLHRAEFPEICERIARSLGRAVAVFGADGRVRAASVRGGEALGGERRTAIATALAALDHAEGGERHLIAENRLLGIALPLATQGRFWMVLDGAPGPLPTLGLLTAATAATAAGVFLAQEEEVEAASRRRTAKTLQEVLESQSPITEALARELGLTPAQRATVLVVEPGPSGVVEARREVMAGLARLFGVRVGAAFDGILVFALQRPLGRAKDWPERLAASLADANLPCRLALGHGERPLSELARDYAAAREALALGRVLRPQANVLHAAHITLLARLARGLTQQEDPRDVSPAIVRLAEQDRSLHGSLIATLECLLDEDGNATLAARRLGIHRHTLLYRLGRIREILGIELDPASRLELRLQLMAWRLAGR